MSHLIEMSNITTRANNQFPKPDFHRLDKQPYRLQPFKRGTKIPQTLPTVGPYTARLDTT